MGVARSGRTAGTGVSAEQWCEEIRAECGGFCRLLIVLKKRRRGTGQRGDRTAAWWMQRVPGWLLDPGFPPARGTLASLALGAVVVGR